MEEILVLKNDEKELSIPTSWRPIFTKIVECFVNKDYTLSKGIEFVGDVSIDTAIQIKDYIEDYGEELINLPEKTWDTSIYMWLGSHWDVVIDLWTKNEGRSDLVLRAKVHEKNDNYYFSIRLVYVM